MRKIKLSILILVLLITNLNLFSQSQTERQQIYNDYVNAVTQKKAFIMSDADSYNEAVENNWFEQIEVGLKNAELFRDGKLDGGKTAGTCETAEPFCTAEGTTYPAGIGTTAQVGPDYGCLGSVPNPVWYYMQILTGGDLQITETNSNSLDVDFIIWGPFTSQNICDQLTVDKIRDCSYSGVSTEYIDLTNCLPGEYYMLLITNFSNTPTNITLAKTGGSAETNCGIIGTPQNIVFAPLTEKTYGDAAFTVSATGGASGNPVTFTSSNTNIATCTGTNGSTITIINAGTCNIIANQLGNTEYAQATPVYRSLVVNKAAQVINFVEIPSKVIEDASFSLSVTGGASGNPIILTNSNPTVATISGSEVTILTLGTTYITASQDGNSNYFEAVDVTRPLYVILQATNTITPNNDGINDKWVFPQAVALGGYNVTIFNNLGATIYGPVTGYNNEWDATYNGKELPSGTYYYIIENGTNVFKGFITVIREKK